VAVKRGRPKGSKNKKSTTKRKRKSKIEYLKFEVIDGKNVCPICKSQKGLECIDCSVKDKNFIFKSVCKNCDVRMIEKVAISEL